MKRDVEMLANIIRELESRMDTNKGYANDEGKPVDERIRQYHLGKAHAYEKAIETIRYYAAEV